MPQWVIQTAEKWGLYWGGYGWSGGCSSPDQFKTSSSRDPMHFEFNGSIDQARAIMCHNLGYTAKFEVVADDGTVEKRCFGPITPPAGTRMVIHTNAPTGATAALVNLTGTNASENGYFTAESCITDPPAMRAWSNGNVRVGRAVAATAIVALDAQGRFCLYNSTSMHSIVDVQGYFAPSGSAPTGALYTPITPTRIVDTRQTPVCTPEGICNAVGPVPAGTEIAAVIAAPVDAIATLSNLTVIHPYANGYATADDCAALLPGPPSHSNINFATGDVVANLTLSPSASTADGERFCTYSQTWLHQLIDVQGFFAPAADGGYGYNSRTPERVVDTRQCWTDALTLVQRCGEKSAAGEIIHVVELVRQHLVEDDADDRHAFLLEERLVDGHLVDRFADAALGDDDDFRAEQFGDARVRQVKHRADSGVPRAFAQDEILFPRDAVEGLLDLLHKGVAVGRL